MIASYQAFRLHVAHDIKYMNDLSQTSLAARICQGDASLALGSTQQDAVDLINAYLPEAYYGRSEGMFGSAQGQLMCVMALVVWGLVALQELRAATDLATGMLHMFRGQPSSSRMFHGTHIRKKDDKWCLVQISNGRICVVALIALARFGLGLCMLFAGLQFLIYTTALEDLVLNTVALECVLGIDELLFATLAPVSMHNLIVSLEAIPLPPVSHWKGFDLHAGLGSLCITVTIAAAVPIWLFPEVDNLQRARAALCKGNQNFVFGSPVMPPFFAWTTSRAFQPVAENEATFVERSVKSIVDSEPDSEAMVRTHAIPKSIVAMNMGSILGTAWSLETQLSWSTPEAAGRFNPSCTDVLGSAAYPSYVMKILRQTATERLTNLPKNLQSPSSANVTSCEDMKLCCNIDSPCGQHARMLCPQTCGCDDPNSMLLITDPSTGCPQQCQRSQKTVATLSALNCTDVPKEKLVVDPMWQHYANGLLTVSNQSGYPVEPVYVAFKQMRRLMLKHGCDAYEKIKWTIAMDVCEEGERRAISLKTFRHWCPVTCKCSSEAIKTNCPFSCF